MLMRDDIVVTRGWSVTIHCGHTFFLCEKQKCGVGVRHLHRPIFYSVTNTGSMVLKSIYNRRGCGI